MSRHLVTVCMFCLLCAAHTCGSHIDPNNDLIYKTIPQDEIDLRTDIHETRKEDIHDSEDEYIQSHENNDLPYAHTIEKLKVTHHSNRRHENNDLPYAHTIEKREVTHHSNRTHKNNDLPYAHTIEKREVTHHHNHTIEKRDVTHHNHTIEKRDVTHHNHTIEKRDVTHHNHTIEKRDVTHHNHTIGKRDVIHHNHTIEKRDMTHHNHTIEKRDVTHHNHTIEKRDVTHHNHTIEKRDVTHHNHTVEKREVTHHKDHKNRTDSLRYIQKLEKLRNSRKKREIVNNVDPNEFVEKIFSLYGDPKTMTMNMTGFNSMLDVLDLRKLVEGGKAEKTESYMFGSADEDDVNCLDSKQLVSTVNTRLKPHSHEHDHGAHSDHNDHNTENPITKDTIKSICPILLYQKLANLSIERGGCVIAKTSPVVVEVDAKQKNMFLVWVYSSLSITVISACGLLGVAVIPIMHKTYYNHLLQFLVALAVGTLCGDALLHLMPHAMSPIEEDHSHNHETAVDLRASHDDGMWKGLAAMLGVVFFYFTEKGLTVVVEWRKRRQKLEEDKLPTRVRVLKDDNTVGGCSGGSKAAITNSTSNSLLKIFKREEKGDPTTKTCKHKYSEYPYCYDEIDTDTHDDHHLRDGQIPPSPKANNHNTVSVVSSIAMKPDGKEEPSAKDWLLKAEPNAMVEMNNIKRKEDGVKDLKDGDSYTVILREHSRAHHGHSHAHGHVHAPPSSIASVAWMVIMGDGLHNFTDGMAIGAAFASNLAGGFSTAIAVLCHELPHELGDFAVLLKAGMSVRRAVCYNVLSSALCLAGMVCGVLAGNAPSATRWLFAVAAGMFLYIALVDMMPELSTSHSNEGTLCQCVLQLMGLATGIGIMLVIALYEHDLKSLFG